MTKKIYRIIGLILVLGAVLTATLVFGFSSGAATTNDYSLVIEYDNTMCEKIILSVDGKDDVEMVSRETYYIPKQKSQFKLTFVMKVGYEIDTFVGSSFTQITPDQKEILIPNTEDQSFELTCKKRQYRIYYENSLSIALSAPSPLPDHYTYGQEDFQIPNPIANGYVFKGWRHVTYSGNQAVLGTLLKPKENEQFCELSATILRDSSDITLRAEWTPIQYYAYRLDHIYNPSLSNKVGDSLYGNNATLNAYHELKDMGEEINGGLSFGGEKHYPGFKFIDEPEYYTSHTVTVAAENEASQINYVHRLYKALEYELVYLSGYDDNSPNFGDSTVSLNHTYNEDTPIPNPTRLGYIFAGWEITVIKNGASNTFRKSVNPEIDVFAISSRDEAYAGDDGTKITLKALWTAEKYAVQYNWNGADENTLQMMGDDTLVAYLPKTEYVYDTALSIPNPIRPGYHFRGWLIGDDTDTANAKIDLTLEAETYSAPITLTAVWEKKTYTVTLNGNGGTWASGETMTWGNVKYDELFPITGLTVPTRVGYTLDGFYSKTTGGTLYIKATADGTAVSESMLWNIDETNPVLYAVWIPNQYGLTVNISLPEGAVATITVDGQEYVAGQKYDYDKWITVRVQLNAGFKVTANDRDPGMAHKADYVFEFRMGAFGADDTTLTLNALPVIANPFDATAPGGAQATVDYVGEKLVLPNGSYSITCGENVLSVVVTDEGITVNGEAVDQVAIPDSFFGQTVEIVKLGDGIQTADSDAFPLALAPRPTAPNLTDGSIAIGGATEHAINVTVGNLDSALVYEFAVATNPDGVGLVWKRLDELTRDSESYWLDGLNPGTNYYVYVRVCASNAEGDAYPHGLLASVARNTEFSNFYKETIEKLEALIGEGDGEMVKGMIDEAKTNLSLIVKPSATFYDDVNKLYEETVAALPFAREQDARLAELRALYNALVASGEFSEDNVAVLSTLLDSGVNDIKTVPLGEDLNASIAQVKARYEATVALMKKVEVKTIASGDMTLIAGNGLPQGTTLSIQQMQEYANLIAAVDAAIAAGKVELAGMDMTVAEAVELLRTLDVMAAYSMSLSGNYNERDATYTLRFKLPEELLTATGLQVAYYNNKTGMLEVLPTTRDGLYLEFTANRIADFVILGDPTVDLTVLIIALGLILACQLIAIILIAARRSRKGGTSYVSIAFPIVALTVRFLPQNGLLLIPILGAAVVIMQVILMVLLLSSDVVHKGAQEASKPRKEKESRKADAAVMADVNDFYADPTAQNADQEEDPFLAFDADAENAVEDAEYEEEEILDEEAFAPEVSEEPDDESTDVFVNLATGEVFGDTDAYEDFIEPAVNPRYSLPDEEYAEEDTESEFTEEELVEEELVEAEAYTWDYDAEAPAEDSIEEETADEDASDEEEMVESAYEAYDDYDDSIRGEPAEDLPQEEPVMGELPEYERKEEQ